MEARLESFIQTLLRKRFYWQHSAVCFRLGGLEALPYLVTALYWRASAPAFSVVERPLGLGARVQTLFVLGDEVG